jgi:hypothetical protein
LNERNGLDDPSDERCCAGSGHIGGLLVSDGHGSSVQQRRFLGAFGLDVVGSGASDGVMRILLMQVLVVSVSVTKFV